MAEQQSKGPIFIVGAPRSGTTLLASFLVSHNNITSGPETQFFNKIGLRDEVLNKALEEMNWPRSAVSLMEERLSLSGQSVLSLYNKDTKQVTNFLESKAPSIGAMLESIVTTEDVRESNKRWLEKTPNHLEFVGDIKVHFPVAKIILIHRDFRDSALSIPKLPWASSSIIENAALIRSWYRSFEKAKELNDVYIQSYEKLVIDPENELRKLFSFIEEPFDSSVLDRNGAAAVTTANEPWKKDVYQKINNQNISKWKGKLEGNLLIQVEAGLDGLIERYGYKAGSSNQFSALRLKRLKKQKLENFDSFAPVLNKHGFKVSYDDELSNNLIYVEEGVKVRACISALKHKLLSGKKIYLLGKKSIVLSLLGTYLN